MVVRPSKRAGGPAEEPAISGGAYGDHPSPMRVSLALLIGAGLLLLHGGGWALTLVPPKKRGEFAGREPATTENASSEWLEDYARMAARLLWLAPVLLVAAVIAWLLGH